ncbi:MAG: ROK family transcriptional regulator [Actinomycetota bacterium]
MIRSLFYPKAKKTSDIRAENVLSVLTTIFTHERLSRKEIINQTSLAPSTVSKITNELMNKGILEKVGNLGKSVPGRKADLLSRSLGAYSVATIHFTPEIIRLGIIDLGYKVLDSKDLYFRNNFLEKDTNTVVEELKKMLEKNSGLKNVAAIGLALPDYPFDSKFIISSFEKAFKLPIYNMNNVEAIALYECCFYLNNKNLNTFIFIYIGTGIGSAVIINGNLYRGVSGKGCDFGHSYITDKPIVCRCKRKGCLEAVASEYFISSEITRHHHINPPLIGKELIDCLSDYIQKGDTFTFSLLKKVAFYFGKGVYNLVSILDPQEVIITGRINMLNPLFSNLVEKSYLNYAKKGLFPIVPLRFIMLKKDSGLIGMAMFTFVSFFYEDLCMDY